MKLHLLHFWLFHSSILFYLLYPYPTTAQIRPDATLPVNSNVVQQGNTSIIQGGTPAGTNLFHSFESFSVPTGGIAFFNNNINIQNIFSRVTGRSISNIDGLIRANGTANLFLINPNGIIFGPNAQLKIGGSFLGNTASSLKFANGIEFSATNPQASPLLSINVPIGLQYGTNPGKIIVRGLGHNIRQDPFTGDITTNNRPGGLQVNEGQTLALIGGEVILQGGNLTVPDGRIQVGSVDADSYVAIATAPPGWLFGYEKVQNFQNISLVQAASLDVSGAGSGNVQIEGKRLTLSEGSIILALKTGSKLAGNLTVRATETLEAIGTSASDNIIASGLLALVSGEGTGTGGNINIETKQLILRDGAQIGAATRGEGQGGTLTVKASESVEVNGTQTNLNFPSGLFTNVQPGVTGDGGDLTIETRRLIVRDGAVIAAGTFSSGNSGNLTVKASESVEVSGTRADGTALSGLFASVQPGATGSGGNLTIETRRLILRDGGAVAVGTFGAGNSGNLTVKASESVEALGSAPSVRFPSGLYTSALAKATGAAGHVTIETGQLIVRNGATVTATSVSSKKAGGLNITAGSIDVDNLGSISADTRSDGGSIELRSPFITLRNSKITTNATGGESGGNINLQGQFLQLRDGSTIATNASGSNTTGGNINLNLNRGILAALENSDITANAQQSRGGKITIDAEAIFGAVSRTKEELQLILNTKNASAIDPLRLLSSDITAISQQGGPQLQGIVTVNTPDIDPSSGLVELPTDLVDVTRLIDRGCPAAKGNSFTVTGRGGLPQLPSEPFRANNTVSVDWVTDDLQEQGSISPTSHYSLLPQEQSIKIVEATGWIINDKGEVVLIASSPVIPNANWPTSTICPTTVESR